MLNELPLKAIDKTDICSVCATRRKAREKKEARVEKRKFQDYCNP